MTNKFLILFGATGSLANLKVLPVIRKIENLTLIAYGRKDVEVMGAKYIKGELNNLEALANFLAPKRVGQIYCYIALPPGLYGQTITAIKKYLGNFNPQIALEKPFGNSLSEAKKLASLIKKQGESDFYLVDHYLAKEGVANLSKVDDIKFIHIAILETIDVEDRRNYYDGVGTIKDVGQNHLLNVLAKLLSKNQSEFLNDLKYKKGSLTLGQYENYGVTDIETYFRADFSYRDIDIVLESGKALNKTSAFVDVTSKSGEVKHFLIKDNPVKTPHQYIIEDFVNDGKEFSLTVDQALAAWRVTEKILEDKKITKMRVYKKGTLPLSA